MQSTILVAGAINTDLVATMALAPEPGETITGTSFAIHSGGKGANQAVAVARSGAAAAMLGAVGDDDFGSARLKDLESEGIDSAWIAKSAIEASGVALIFVEKHGENRIAYVPGATSTVGRDHCLRALADVRPGIVLATNELPTPSLLALFRRAREIGATVVLNAAPDPERAVQLLAHVDIVILNAIEAARMLTRSGPVDPRQAIASLRARGPATVIITAGADGVIGGTNGNGIFAQAPPSVPVVDTTGAGDTFCGAFAASLATGSSIPEAARYAVMASALSVTERGAQAGIPTRERVERLIATL